MYGVCQVPVVGVCMVHVGPPYLRGVTGACGGGCDVGPVFSWCGPVPHTRVMSQWAGA